MRKKQMLGKFLPPKSDVAFRELMRNEMVRRHFISDVLGISLEEIREVRLENTFLSRRSRREKQGILDVRVLLNNNCRINIELQVREVPAWDKRSLFYLSKMYAEEAHAGEDYSPLKKCIVICILGFKWNDSPSYHKVYYLKDQEGQLYSDQFEMHIIELGKELTGDQLDDWIRLFRVENIGELQM
ncbi:MAG: Rpn family recombination-promoting nuclease/putative transposase, partial [Acetatifactor sp.]|nr:Rpn family recombination-promoting nuclease/putative transposase [Acetatifactor sp.]